MPPAQMCSWLPHWPPPKGCDLMTTETRIQSAPPKIDSSLLKRAMVAGLIGHLVEWYDYGVYAYVAKTLAAVFFPSTDPTAALLAVFATFAVAFFARPLGGLFFGSLGDRIGRQRCFNSHIAFHLCHWSASELRLRRRSGSGLAAQREGVAGLFGWRRDCRRDLIHQ